MPDGARGSESETDCLRAALETERAVAEHWRGVARLRSGELASLRRRRTVRAALAADRRLEPVRAALEAAARSLTTTRERAALRVGHVTSRAAPPPERLRPVLAGLPAPPTEHREVTLVTVGSERALRPSGDLVVETVAVDGGAAAVDSVAGALATAGGELLVVMLGTSEPLEESWLARLASSVRGDVVAAVPMLVHPLRRARDATSHDGLVRSRGLVIELDARGAPAPRAIEPGTVPDPRQPADDVDAGSAACVVVDRTAYQRVGGLTAGSDLEVAVLELCARLRWSGGRIVAVPGATVVDHRPVRSRQALRRPIEPAAAPWRAAVDRSGPVLHRIARPVAPGTLRFLLTVAAPSAKVALRWGDWHLAAGLASSLRARGHDAVVQPLEAAEHPASRAFDVHLVLRGLARVRRSPGQRHVLWIISHPETVEDDELDAADLVLVASARFAEHVRSRTTTPVEVMLQATDASRFAPVPVDAAHRHQVTVVAKTRGVLRPAVADALAVGLRPAIYGGGWRDLVDPTLIVADHVDHELLPAVYSSAGVVLNDHWRTMRAWGFVSNRLYDVLACRAPVVSDPVDGIPDLFDGAVLEYRSRQELRSHVDGILADPETARIRAERGRRAVLADHTFDHRAAELLAALECHRPR